MAAVGEMKPSKWPIPIYAIRPLLGVKYALITIATLIQYLYRGSPKNIASVVLNFHGK